MNTHDTREGWLKSAIALLDQKFFAANGYELPVNVKAACGPVGLGLPKAIGVCYDKSASVNEHHEIFIAGTQAEPARVLDILLHELIHACVGCKEGHKGKFKKLAKQFGFAGKMTATFVEPGSELEAQLAEIVDQLGPYPHAAMVKAPKPSRQPKRLTFYSPQEPKFMVTVKIPVVEEFGAPKDPWGNTMKKDGDEDEVEDDASEDDSDE
ncbi:MAG: hypothetical protein ACXWWG_00520 [Nitrospira sp.]